jgi:hypothetical protein
MCQQHCAGHCERKVLCLLRSMDLMPAHWTSKIIVYDSVSQSYGTNRTVYHKYCALFEEYLKTLNSLKYAVTFKVLMLTMSYKCYFTM